MPVKDRIKRRVLPSGIAPRTISAGAARGVRMRLDFATKSRLFFGLYEVEVGRHLRRLLTPGMLAFDVGANIGYYSLAIANLTHAAVAAFDWNQGYLDELQANVTLNPALMPLVRPVRAMVGTAPGELRLDDWAHGEGFVPDFIKIDIDGHEVDALQSAASVLVEHRPSLIVETHSAGLEREAGNFLVRHGYRPLIVSQRQILPDFRPTEHNRWLVAWAD